MNTFVVLLVLGVMLPTHPQYDAYVKQNGHSIVFVRETLDNLAQCREREEGHIDTAAEHNVELVYSQCVEAVVDMGKVRT